MCANFLPEHDGAIIVTIEQLLRLIFEKIWVNREINIYSKCWVLELRGIHFLTR